jgi:Fic family protein
MKMPEKPRPFEQICDEKVSRREFDKESFNLAKRYNEEYIHWDELRRKDLSDPEYVWALMKISRESQSKHADFGDTVLSYNITNKAQQIIHLLDTGASGSVVVEEPLSDSEMERYVVSSLMEEAIASSQLEGAVTTTKEAKRMLREGRKPRSQSEQMIVNDYLTMRKVKEISKEPLTVSSIQELHRFITHNTLEEPSFEGRFREDDETLVMDPLEGTIYHQPPSHTKIPEYIEKLCIFANDENRNDFQHPLLKAIILHFMIGYVHPFIEGNGRLARALMYWYALRSNYWLFEYMAVSKVIKQSRGRYGAAYLYSETDDNDVTYFINYNLECMDKALENTKVYIRKKQREQKSAIKLVNTHPELNFRQAGILNDLIKHKDEPVTIAEIVSKFNVVHQTAKTDLMLLTNLGFIELRKVGRKMFFVYRKD